ncbi:Uncharacterised protein [Mycobacteroides abscessus subsp. abscessus]|nr:Uncharacterised protein [Mycobacteroides abscessus subsp. abscessus]
MTLLAKIVHLGWTAKGPELLALGRRNWPATFRPTASWYHDYPTTILALVGTADGLVDSGVYAARATALW